MRKKESEMIRKILCFFGLHDWEIQFMSHELDALVYACPDINRKMAMIHHGLELDARHGHRVFCRACNKLRKDYDYQPKEGGK
jgi:hypothetical protein